MSLPSLDEDIKRGCQQWLEAAASHGALGAWMKEAASHGHKAWPLLAAVVGHSPYLTRLLLTYPELLQQLLEDGIDAAYARLTAELAKDNDLPVLMKRLRVSKNKLALLVALADIGGMWPLEKVTGALSSFAEASVSQAVEF